MLWMKKTCSREERREKSLKMKATADWQLLPPKCYLPSAMHLSTPCIEASYAVFVLKSYRKTVLRKCLQSQTERPRGQGPSALSCPQFCIPTLQFSLSPEVLYTACIARVTKKKPTFNLTQIQNANNYSKIYI